MGRTYRAARRRRQRRLKQFGLGPHYGYNWRMKRGRSRVHWAQGRFWLEAPGHR